MATRSRSSKPTAISDRDRKQVEKLCATWREIVELRDCLTKDIEEDQRMILNGGPVMRETCRIMLEKHTRRLEDLDRSLLPHTKRSEPPWDLLWRYDPEGTRQAAVAGAVVHLHRFLEQLDRGNKVQRRKRLAAVLNDTEKTTFGTLPPDADDLAHAFHLAMRSVWDAYRRSDPTPRISTRRWSTHFRKVIGEVVERPDSKKHSKEGPKFEAMEIIAKLLDVDPSTVRNSYQDARFSWDPSRLKRRVCATCSTMYWVPKVSDPCPECEQRRRGNNDPEAG